MLGFQQEKLNNLGNINFLVYIDVNFINALTGGVVVMHQLAYKLAEKGQKVKMIINPEYVHENIEVISLERLRHENKENYVVVYPQIIRNNPTEIPNVARWMLYHSEIDNEITYGKDDDIFNFGSFKTYTNKEVGKLTVFNYYFDVFKNENKKRNKKFCHLMHKNTPKHGDKIFQYLGSEDLGGWKSMGCHDYLKDRFNECEYLLTYDQKSFFPLAAGMCGTKTIILNPDNSLTPTEYRIQNPIQMFGVAYGWDDISWAEKTIEFVPNYIKELEKIDNKTVDSFIKHWYSKLDKNVLIA